MSKQYPPLTKRTGSFIEIVAFGPLFNQKEEIMTAEEARQQTIEAINKDILRQRQWLEKKITEAIANRAYNISLENTEQMYEENAQYFNSLGFKINCWQSSYISYAEDGCETSYYWNICINWAPEVPKQPSLFSKLFKRSKLLP